MGLSENMDRVRYRRAVEVLLGVGAAFSRGSLARAWFDALARFPEQASALEWETNGARAHARAMAKGH